MARSLVGEEREEPRIGGVKQDPPVRGFLSATAQDPEAAGGDRLADREANSRTRPAACPPARTVAGRC